MTSYDGWDTAATVEAELTNNLILVDQIVCSISEVCTPEFHVLGGAALIFNGVNYKNTLDIDTANVIDVRIKEEVSDFISDMAAEVVILPKKYKDRLIPFRPELFERIKVFILSNVDVVFTKLTSERAKDLGQLTSTNILETVDMQELTRIIENESPDPLTVFKTLKKLDMLVNKMTS